MRLSWPDMRVCWLHLRPCWPMWANVPPPKLKLISYNAIANGSRRHTKNASAPSVGADYVIFQKTGWQRPYVFQILQPVLGTWGRPPMGSLSLVSRHQRAYLLFYCSRLCLLVTASHFVARNRPVFWMNWPLMRFSGLKSRSMQTVFMLHDLDFQLWFWKAPRYCSSQHSCFSCHFHIRATDPLAVLLARCEAITGLLVSLQ